MLGFGIQTTSGVFLRNMIRLSNKSCDLVVRHHPKISPGSATVIAGSIATIIHDIFILIATNNG